MLIGEEIFLEMLSEGRLKLADPARMQNTKWAWIVSGKRKQNCESSSMTVCHLTVDDSLDEQLQRF